MTTPGARESVCACIIARDEEERLPEALASVAFCDEVIVVDSGSRDRTIEIAHAAGARVVENPWSGYGAQRNVDPRGGRRRARHAPAAR
jgi:glycosyltransferase involved in cell wall biosynthesis